MRFVADESLEREVVERLRQAGHEVWYVSEIEKAISDDEVLKLANEHQALLISADKDFGELVFRDGRAALGVILLRLHGLSPERKASIVTATIRQHESELPNCFTVIAPGSTRVRPRLL